MPVIVTYTCDVSECGTCATVPEQQRPEPFIRLCFLKGFHEAVACSDACAGVVRAQYHDRVRGMVLSNRCLVDNGSAAQYGRYLSEGRAVYISDKTGRYAVTEAHPDVELPSDAPPPLDDAELAAYLMAYPLEDPAPGSPRAEFIGRLQSLTALFEQQRYEEMCGAALVLVASIADATDGDVTTLVHVLNRLGDRERANPIMVEAVNGLLEQMVSNVSQRQRACYRDLRDALHGMHILCTSRYRLP